MSEIPSMGRSEPLLPEQTPDILQVVDALATALPYNPPDITPLSSRTDTVDEYIVHCGLACDTQISMVIAQGSETDKFAVNQGFLLHIARHYHQHSHYTEACRTLDYLIEDLFLCGDDEKHAVATAYLRTIETEAAARAQPSLPEAM